MRPIRYTARTALLLILCQASIHAFCQLGFNFDIKKPTEYEERTLRSERSDKGKFSLPVRFIQNTVTHFNYYYNANLKLNEVLERAKEMNRDDYSKLLPFYNYTLESTMADSIQLDSITFKSSSGIALHDLRGDWVDNLYLLWGAAYYLQKKFDSAYLMFQFINYAFAEKEKDGYYRTIGSGRDGNSALSIATKEKKSLPKKLFSQPPSRNDAFIWQIRNFLAQDQLAEAASLIVTLRNDPLFPKRLHNDLHEVQSYWFYKQNIWDSAAIHLVKALSNATNLQEKARWEYLVAQLFELSGNYKNAEKYYSKVIGHTTDLVLEIYARLAALRTDRDGGEKSIEKNVAELVRMAKRDKYREYRDIIYYMAAQMQLTGNNSDAAIALLKKSTQMEGSSILQRNKGFLQLAELSFAKKKYRDAYNYYDSINTSDPTLPNPEEIKARKKVLAVIAENSEIVYRLDSLQRVAAMPEDARKEFIKKLVKQLRKASGLKDETAPKNPLTTNNPPPTGNLFAGNENKSEWYFYNTASRQRGNSEFKSKWGNRPNVDNWRRSNAIIGVATNPGNKTGSGPAGPGGNPTGSGGTELTYDALYANLPLTPEQITASNDSIQAALFALGKAYILEIEDCQAGTESLEQLRARFPDFQPMDEVLFNIYYCYKKNGETAKADAIKKLMSEKFANSNLTAIANTGKDPTVTKTDIATKTYERIYDLFIEGNFELALTEKKSADSIYSKNYWTPQLLYIEAVYHVKQRNDSAATRVLENILNQFPGTPLFNKATILIEVLKRRAQIEEELRNMVVTRATDSTKGSTIIPVVTKPTNTVPDSTRVTRPVVTNPINTNPPKDTTSTKPPPKINSPYTFDPNAQYNVVVILNKVDPVFINEAKNAFARFNRDYHAAKNYSADLFDLDGENRLLLIAPFANAAAAVAYVDATRPRTASEIIPWLKGGKYSYTIMTSSNLELMKVNKDLETYRNFLNQYFPGKF